MVKTKIDGQYIDDLITGFRTLGVDGREELDLDVVSSEIDTSDGGRYMRRRIKSRVLKVHFYLSDATATGFSAKLNTLKTKLHSIKESQIIFSDDDGVYLTGTFRKLTLAYKGREVTRGTIEILCADPFKYSLTEHTCTAVDGTITAEYGGTYPAYPVLTAQSATHDCGFYSFSDQDGHLIQIGNPEEEDQEEEPTDRVVATLDSSFGINYWPSYAPYDPVWHPDRARLLYGYVTESQGFRASQAYIYSLPGYPSGDPNTFFGGALGVNIDASPNFSCSFVHWFEPSGNQGGGFDLYINNSGGGNIAGVCIRHGKGDLIKAYLIVKGKVVKTMSYTLANNPFGSVWRTETITKTLGTVSFNVGGVTFTVTDPDLADHSYDARNVSFIIYKQPNADQIGENNALKSIQFRGYASSWVDVENVIPREGLVSVDTGSGEISVNDDPQPNLGSIYNAFEDFKLTGGENQIACSSSGWVDDAVYTMRYREVFL